MTSAGCQTSNGRIQSLGTDANAYLMNHGRLDRLRSPPAQLGSNDKMEQRCTLCIVCTGWSLPRLFVTEYAQQRESHC